MGVGKLAEKRVLMLVTNTGQIEGGPKTGLWLEEFAVPYEKFTERGYQVQVASIKGGKAPIDERSLPKDGRWEEAIKRLEDTVPLHALSAEAFDALFLPGGHGTMFDLPGNPDLEKVIRALYESGKVVAAVCHGPAGFVDMRLSDGQYLVKGKKLTSFTNEEERAGKLERYMPFLLESRLREQGAIFEKKPLWSDHVVIDGNLITGQNPQSSKSIAEAVIDALENK